MSQDSIKLQLDALLYEYSRYNTNIYDIISCTNCIINALLNNRLIGENLSYSLYVLFIGKKYIIKLYKKIKYSFKLKFKYIINLKIKKYNNIIHKIINIQQQYLDISYF